MIKGEIILFKELLIFFFKFQAKVAILPVILFIVLSCWHFQIYAFMVIFKDIQF